MSARAELRRIDAVAPWWFAFALLATAIATGALVLSGWRPSQLPPPAGLAWWLGAILTASGLAAIGYAGCPIYWGNVRIAHRQKSLAIRAGLVLYLVGGAIAFIAVFAN